jgi:hypothetical protein
MAYPSAFSNETDAEGDEFDLRIGEWDGLDLVFFGSNHFE